ncbi:MAG: NAD(P)H-dependent oxidoreductase subunit E [Deltaproteobacteria bacterium]|jgi:NADH-quinone oxidoreductase subunit E|nr:NAD(P)H-dependent oxidoreductase subunit E [Deltaproteobacteria bacterium]
MPEPDEKTALAILEGYRFDPQQIIAALLDIQEASGRSYVDPLWARLAARKMGVPVAAVYEILTFYSMFSLEPRGRRLVEVCRSAPCLFTGADDLLASLSGLLGVGAGETTPDGLFTLSVCGCVGRCAGSPVVKIGEEAFSVLNAAQAGELLRSYREDDPAAREALRCRD